MPYYPKLVRNCNLYSCFVFEDKVVVSQSSMENTTSMMTITMLLYTILAVLVWWVAWIPSWGCGTSYETLFLCRSS